MYFFVCRAPGFVNNTSIISGWLAGRVSSLVLMHHILCWGQQNRHSTLFHISCYQSILSVSFMDSLVLDNIFFVFTYRVPSCVVDFVSAYGLLFICNCVSSFQRRPWLIVSAFYVTICEKLKFTLTTVIFCAINEWSLRTEWWYKLRQRRSTLQD